MSTPGAPRPTIGKRRALGDATNSQGQARQCNVPAKWAALGNPPDAENILQTRDRWLASKGAQQLSTSRASTRPRVLAPSHGATSLRSLAIRVANAVKRMGPCTYGEVADSLVRDSSGTGSVDAMSVRRRVNDALNVLVAAGVVVRTKEKIISWNWIFEGGAGVREGFAKVAQAKARLFERETKKAALEQQIRSFETLMTRNALSQSADVNCEDPRAGLDSGVVSFPFVLVAMNHVDAKVQAFGNNSRTNVDVTLEAPFQILDDRAVLERVITLPPAGSHGHTQFNDTI